MLKVLKTSLVINLYTVFVLPLFCHGFIIGDGSLPVSMFAEFFKFRSLYCNIEFCKAKP